MKDLIKDLKVYIFVKRTQRVAYSKHKGTLADGTLLVHVDFAESYQNYQQDRIQNTYFGNQILSLFTSCYYYKSPDNIFQEKGIAIITVNSDHKRVTSMSSLKKLPKQWKNESGKKLAD